MDKKDLLNYACHFESSILKRVRNKNRKSAVTVLMYHGVNSGNNTDDRNRCSEYNISKDVFEIQMRYLAENCTVISATDAFEGKNISNDKRNIVISFDDGYRNNYFNALPILKKYGMPAVFSITTGWIEEKSPLWNDIIEWLIRYTDRDRCEITLDNFKRCFSLENNRDRTKFYNWALNYAVNKEQNLRDDFILSIADSLNMDIDKEKILLDEDYAPLKHEDILNMSEQRGVEIASHSVNHYNLVNLNEEQIENELLESKKTIESITYNPCRVFCVPGGKYNKQCLYAIKNAGYRIVMTSDIDPYIHKHGVDFVQMGRTCITTQHDSIDIYQSIANGYLLHSYYKAKALKGSLIRSLSNKGSENAKRENYNS